MRAWWQAKHQWFKRLSRKTSHVNLLLTLSERHQFWMSFIAVQWGEKWHNGAGVCCSRHGPECAVHVATASHGSQFSHCDTAIFLRTLPATVLDAACHAIAMLGHGSKTEQQWPMHPPDPPPLLSPGAKMQAVPAGDMQGKQLPRCLQRHPQRVGGLTTRRPTSKLRASSTPVRRTTGAASQG